jgi:MFS family permease
VTYCGTVCDQESVSKHSLRNILNRDFVFGFLTFFSFLFAYFALIPTLPVYRGNEKIILVFTLTSMIALLILSFSRTLPMFIFVGLLWGGGAAFMFPVSMAYALDYAGSSGGTAVGTFRAVMDLGMALGPMVMGMIIPTIGYPAMFLFLAFICLINLCYFQFYVRKSRSTQPRVETIP